MADDSIKKIIEILNLKPHPEGGFFAETYRSGECLDADVLPGGYEGARPLSTAIYYMLTRGTFSEMHRLASDEIFHFYIGDPVEMLLLYPDGTGKIVMLGADISAGMSPQVVVPKGVWQGARVAGEGEYALLGTTVAPGFEFADYERGDREKLCSAYPQHEKLIQELTGF